MTVIEDNKVNTIAVSLTVLQIFLSIVAIGGFWMVRNAAINAAKDEAYRVANEMIPAIVNRIAADYFNALISEDIDDQQMMNELDNENGPQ